MSAVKKNVGLWLLATLFFVFLLATIFSVDRYYSLWGDPERSGGFVNFTLYIILAMLTFFIVKREDWLKIWKISIGVGVLVSGVAIIQFYGLFGKIFIAVANRSPSTLGNAISLGMYLLILFFMTLSFALKENTIIKKMYYLSCLLLFAYIILISGGRAAYLGLLVGIIYFVIGYPKKLLLFKIILGIFLVLTVCVIYYANAHPELPTVLKQNKIIQAVYPRLSISQFLNDARFSAWKIAFMALKEKPVLGWGPENFSVGFDKHYDPSLPFIGSSVSDWWDKAHNIILDIGVQAGILGVLAYLALFCYLFWKLEKTKSNQNDQDAGKKIVTHGIQATLVAYITANFFSFDNFETYLLFFLTIGYALHVIYGDQKIEITESRAPQKKTLKAVTIFILFFMLLFFIWQYNIIPFQVNVKINTASDLSYSGRCDAVPSVMEKAIAQHSFLYVYSRAKYVDFLRTCAYAYPEKNLAYANRGIEVMKEAVKVQPLFTRLWIFLGSFTTVKASAEQDSNKKTELLAKAQSYLARANELTPNHHEVIIEQAKNDAISGDFKDMQQKAETCIAFYPTLGDCWWYKALSLIYVKDNDGVQKNLQIAKNKNFDTESLASLHQLASTYATAKNYQGLVLTYQKLIAMRPDIAQYHASLAFAYSALGQYQKARQEALVFLKLMPEAKNEVDAFLKTLPY